jgi:O-antigen/teichoic acid export membrane protein
MTDRTTAVDERDAAPGPEVRTAAPGRSYVQTALGSAAVLALNVGTGVLTARLLDPDGRGAVGAIAGWVTMLAFLGGMGFRDGLVYASRHGTASAQVLTAGLASVAVLGVVTVLAGELLVPLGFSAQTGDVVELAMIFMVWVIPLIAYNTFGSLLGARHRFGVLNLQRVAQPLLYAVLLCALWASDAVTVARVLAVHMASFVIVAVLALIVLAGESGFGALDRPLVGEASRYGVRVYGTTIGQLANLRLDVMLLPAVVAASEIGYYVVAVSAASMVAGLFGSVDMAVFPLAARLPSDEAVDLIERTVRVTFVASLAANALLGVAAPVLVTWLYGPEFESAVPALRLLLPGIVMWATASVIIGGLKALGLPQKASIAQLVGAGVTIVGLAVSLGPFGIEGAAVTSSVAYTVVCLLALWFLVKASARPTTEMLDLRRTAGDVRWLAATMTAGR